MRVTPLGRGIFWTRLNTALACSTIGEKRTTNLERMMLINFMVTALAEGWWIGYFSLDLHGK
jgi:hypothetical protein